MIPGLTVRVTTAGIPVMRIHYTADPKKRPGTAEGDRWLAQSMQGYPGGMQSPRWRKEMEVDYSAMSGEKLFPLWEVWRTSTPICLPRFTPTGYALYGSYDHGWRCKAAYHVHGINGDGKKVTLWEFWADHVPITSIARIIKGETVLVPPGYGYDVTRTFRGNPYAGQEIWKVADPSLWADDNQQSDGTMKQTAKLFSLEGVYFLPGTRGGDTTMAELILGTHWRDPMQPTWQIVAEACPGLVSELGQLRLKEFSAQVALNRAQPEELVDKDCDAWDSCKYFHAKFPPRASEPKPSQAPGTFAWWREQHKREQRGEPVRSYRREVVG